MKQRRHPIFRDLTLTGQFGAEWVGQFERNIQSVEPQLDELTLLPWLKKREVDWVIQGGESGPKRRPFDTDWARKLRDECAATMTPYFFKQVDKVMPIPKDLLIRQFPPFGMAA